jgi:hypothetical protein
MQELISAIMDLHYGKPILVIGGGPSVTEDIERLPLNYFSAVISANEHGCRQHRFRVDYMHNVDKTHLERKMPMREFMRPFKIPVINRHSWADFRIPRWKLVTNSGLSAVAVAALLGGHPVVTTGIDLWVGGNIYFHRINPKHRTSPTRDGLKNKMRELQQWCSPAVLRSLRGPVAEHHGVFDMNEALPDVQPHSFRSTIGPTVHAVATRDFMWESLDPVSRGTILAIEAAEWRKFSLKYPIRRV